MITVEQIKESGFKFNKSLDLDAQAGLITHFYQHGEEDLSGLLIDVDFIDGNLNTPHCIDVMVPSFILRNCSKDRLDQIISLLRPLDGEIVTIFE